MAAEPPMPMQRWTWQTGRKERPTPPSSKGPTASTERLMWEETIREKELAMELRHVQRQLETATQQSGGAA